MNAAPDHEWFRAPTLTGGHVRLEPLSSRHVDGLLAAADDPAIFAWSAAPVTDLATAAAYVDAALAATDRIAFAQVDAHTGAVLGTTSLYDLTPRHRNLSIGYTWLASAAQGTTINPEAKLLLLRHAFVTLGAVRVEWHVDELNERSRRAVLRLGAQFEGLLAKHRQRLDGSWRTTALFSMTDDAWPDAEAALNARLRPE
ncbi:GNAT family protein [Rhodococcus sp. HNM0569]|uniref:GNAT family N-acetyltransferase n=1 Tax=Rhodococcus sp. HNM0569 TaxID=2716340 RepID=UPI00146E4D53|nr:GNAT family protein [Rhodococcus sp. HNM0569]NLU84276.1 GNAT family N-acetyltransferase [Rhodococcus sp. HNM0569]